MIRTKATESQSPGALHLLVAGGFGLWILFWFVRRLRSRSYCRDKVVVITGASSGLGEECARVFHAAGARLVICGRHREKLEELRDSLLGRDSNPGETARVPCVVTFDLGEPEAVEEAARTVLKCHSRVDVLLNCAGLSARGDVQDTTLAVHRRLMDVNYFGTIALTKGMGNTFYYFFIFNCLYMAQGFFKNGLFGLFKWSIENTTSVQDIFFAAVVAFIRAAEQGIAQFAVNHDIHMLSSHCIFVMMLKRMQCLDLLFKP
uniref:Dehydrogenase/reductase SDR family member 7B n=1 Tax=Eptatretus burgeri TaxID=7764 RepID=A0A8C4QFC9_EPTBU